MPIFIVKMEHPDGAGWAQHVVPHVEYLKELIDKGSLIASGPMPGSKKRAGFLVMKGENQDQIEKLISEDPFAIEGLICDLWIAEWDPLFGVLSTWSTQKVPPEVAELFESKG